MCLHIYLIRSMASYNKGLTITRLRALSQEQTWTHCVRHYIVVRSQFIFIWENLGRGPIKRIVLSNNQWSFGWPKVRLRSPQKPGSQAGCRASHASREWSDIVPVKGSGRADVQLSGFPGWPLKEYSRTCRPLSLPAKHFNTDREACPTLLNKWPAPAV